MIKSTTEVFVHFLLLFLLLIIFFVVLLRLWGLTLGILLFTSLDFMFDI